MHSNKFLKSFQNQLKLKTEYSKNLYIGTLNIEGQAVIGSYLIITNTNINQAVKFVNRFLIYETNVHDNLHSY